jgi:NitT/TauT family transport system substrate-binding protein
LGAVNVIEVRQHLNMSSDVFVVREETYQQRKEVLRRFLQGYRDSMQWMIQSPQEAAQLATQVAIDGQNPAINLEIIKLRNVSSVSTLTQQRGLGAIDVEALQRGANVYKQLGLISRDLRIAEVVSQDLLPGRS